MEGSRWQWTFVCAVLLSLPAPAADVGGWFADRQRAAAQASNPAADDCPQAIARATLDPSASGAYHAGLCYLEAAKPDMVAAKAWLSRSAELNFLPAHRLLRALQVAEAGLHSPVPHCHALDEGRQMCHGGAPVVPVAAAAPTN